MFFSQFLICFLTLPIFTMEFVKLRIINTRILQNIPTPKWHPIVLLESHHTKEKIAIDLTPIRTKFTTIQLIFGRNVPAKIRIRSIPNEMNIENRTEIISFFEKDDSEISDSMIRTSYLKKLVSEINDFKDFRRFNYTMNLYTRNCRHFYKHIIYLHNNFIYYY